MSIRKQQLVFYIFILEPGFGTLTLTCVLKLYFFFQISAFVIYVLVGPYNQYYNAEFKVYNIDWYWHEVAGL